MFAELIEQLHQTTGQQVVILIDEYDKPMIDSLNKAKEIHQEIKETLHNFYQVIKGSDEHIKFMFMTGVSRFAGLSVFSALNNLYDITMDTEYASICGYTQEELENNFKEYIKGVSDNLNISYQESINGIKHWYNGYSWDGKTYVYNPFSTLSFFRNREFVGYWFSTGTPTFLIEQIKKKDDLELLVETKIVSERTLRGNSNYANVNSVALLFQTGYLTIKKKERVEEEQEYTIDFPNYEVRSAFLCDLLEAYTGKDIIEVQILRTKLIKALRSKDSTFLEEVLKSLYASIPYDLHIGKEAYYQSLFMMLARAAEIEVEGEVHTDKGRIDVVLKNKEIVAVVEIKYVKDNNKVEEMLKEAMLQIRRNKYYEKYTDTNPILLGIVFSENKDISCRFENI
jgi:Holliday junction resolvase-like predicted endonuclease